MFGRVQTKAAAIGVGAFGQQQHLMVQSMGTRVKHSLKLMQFKPTTPSQKEQEISPIQEQYHMLSQNEKPKYTYGSLVIGFIPKDERPNKTGPRAFRGFYAGSNEDIPGDIIVHPFTTSEDGKNWEILPSLSLNKFKMCEGVMILASPPGKYGGIPMEFRKPSEGEMTYAEVREEFFIPYLVEPDSDSEGDSDSEEEEEEEWEIEKIVSHRILGDGTVKYRVRWKGYDSRSDRYRTEEQMQGCIKMLDEYKEAQGDGIPTTDQMMVAMAAIEKDIQQLKVDAEEDIEHMVMSAIMFEDGQVQQGTITEHQACYMTGSDLLEDEPDLAMGVTEVKPKEFVQTEAGKEAWARELREMTARRLDFDKPVPEHLKKAAMEARVVCTYKRDMTAKARLVMKDLKARRKLDPIKTYAAVPPLYGIRLMLALTNQLRYIKSTCDLVTAYLQQEEWEQGSWMLVKWRDPFTNEWVFAWLRGETYGLQTAGSGWKKSLVNRMIMKGGFREIKNMENMYYHPERDIRTCIFVDDPLTSAPGEDNHEWFHKFMSEEFDIKGVDRLTPDTPVDYLSMKISMDPSGTIYLTNEDKIDLFLQESGFEDIEPTKYPPLTKAKLKTAYQQDEPLDEAEIKEFQQNRGRVNWIAQTTHPVLSTASSIFSGMPTIQGTKQVAKEIFAWLQAHKKDGIIIEAGNNDGLEVHVDSDWGGMHSVCGEVRSRSGILIRVNKVPVYWKSSLQKVTSTQFDPELDPDTSVGQEEIATSSGYGETLAGADATTATLHIGYVADELGAPFPKPNIINIDATAAKSFFENTGGASKMKHIDIRSKWVQLVRDRHQFEFAKVDGTKNPADTFTKLLDRPEFDPYHRELMYTDADQLRGVRE